MLKLRIIPILTFNGFALVKTKRFEAARMVGNPIQAARVYNSRGVDELVFVDILASPQERNLDITLVKDILRECYMPVAVGGGIASLDDISVLLTAGADKVVLKSAAIRTSEFVSDAAKRFGAQCICIAADAKKSSEGYIVYNPFEPNLRLEDFVSRVESAGAGELIISSVDRDGTMTGFDTDLIALTESLSTLPIIACGGAGNPGHFRELFERCPIEAAAAASIFHFTRYTPNDIKRELHQAAKPVRLLHEEIAGSDGGKSASNAK
jgi:imidazole glycerol-phosphate synthase subunit HisF